MFISFYFLIVKTTKSNHFFDKLIGLHAKFIFCKKKKSSKKLSQLIALKPCILHVLVPGDAESAKKMGDNFLGTFQISNLTRHHRFFQFFHCFEKFVKQTTVNFTTNPPIFFKGER